MHNADWTCNFEHEMMIACVIPSELILGAIEAAEANPISSNENAADYAKRLFK
jgi:hypothetical protein